MKEAAITFRIRTLLCVPRLQVEIGLDGITDTYVGDDAWRLLWMLEGISDEVSDDEPRIHAKTRDDLNPKRLGRAARMLERTRV